MPVLYGSPLRGDEGNHKGCPYSSSRAMERGAGLG